MKVLVTGKNGQVGSALIENAPRNIELFPFDHQELDITSKDILKQKINQIKPDYIINTAAYTNVDKAEEEPDEAYKTNVIGPGYLSEHAKSVSAKLIHLSTDFVFDGSKTSPYSPHDAVCPLSVYGKSKAEGESLVRKNYPAKSVILRTSWVYSVTGKNFVKTILNLISQKNELRIVSDQIGCPTWSKNIALTIWQMVFKNIDAGIYHWSDNEPTSWYDFAVAIYKEANAINLVEKEIVIIPIPTSDFPTLARRPPYSVLDISQTKKLLDVESEHWRSALRKMLIEYQKLIETSLIR